MSNSFGKFDSFDDFIDSYEREKRSSERVAIEESLGLEGRRRRNRRPPRQARERNIVEVKGTLRIREPDDTNPPKHYHLLLTVKEVLDSDPDVDRDVQRCVGTEEDVFVAIRFGDRMGILEDIDGLSNGAELHLRGEWLTRQEATDHGGRDLSVLHFTHDPIGFICVGTPGVCYS